MNSARLCACGCGGYTGIAKTANVKYGVSRGEPNVYIHGHHCKGRPRLDQVKRYRTQYRRGNSPVLLHRVRAEKALGKPLPEGAIVHHADGTKGDNAPLVICPDDSYHQLLHARMRIKAAGGNPNADLICSKCRAVKPYSAFHKKSTDARGYTRWCRDCYSAWHRLHLQRKRGAA